MSRWLMMTRYMRYCDDNNVDLNRDESGRKSRKCSCSRESIKQPEVMKAVCCVVVVVVVVVRMYVCNVDARQDCCGLVGEWKW